jgi:hypothetical protein
MLSMGSGLKIKASVTWGALMRKDVINNLHSTGSQGISDSSLNLQSQHYKHIKQFVKLANEKAKQFDIQSHLPH